jgi:general secretion pathway protein G
MGRWRHKEIGHFPMCSPLTIDPVPASRDSVFGKELGMLKRVRQTGGEEGFTLIELLIVIIILAILAAIVVFAVGSTGTNAAQAACKSDAKSVETAIEAYKAQHPGTGYPSTYAQLTTSDASGGPWLKAQPSTKDYNIMFDNQGHVWVNGPGSSAAYTTAQDIDLNPDTACSNVAVAS